MSIKFILGGVAYSVYTSDCLKCRRGYSSTTKKILLVSVSLFLTCIEASILILVGDMHEGRNVMCYHARKLQLLIVISFSHVWSCLEYMYVYTLSMFCNASSSVLLLAFLVDFIEKGVSWLYKALTASLLFLRISLVTYYILCLLHDGYFIIVTIFMTLCIWYASIH